MNEREIFTEALLRPTKELRAAYLDEACGGDSTLRQRVEQLLTMHEGSQALFDRRLAELLESLGDDPDESDAATLSMETVTKQLSGYLEAATRPDALGRLGHYEVLKVLGVGGFGIVVKAFDESLHRVVAIKVLAPHLTVTSPPRKRFLREARAAAQVRDEHVVQIYAVEEQPIPHLVMEFIEGQTLQQRLDGEGPLDAAEVVRLGRQIALGLAAAHEQGLIHRDVKPANILIETGLETRVKLTDFGLARATDDASMTQSGVVAGTPTYMAPEQAQGEPLDQRTDLFSLGSVLYTMTTGRPPFRAPNTLAVLKRVREDKPRPIREVIAGVPEGLCAVILRLLEKNPANRFATAKEAAAALSHCLTNPPAAQPDRSGRRKLALVAAAALFLTGVVWIVNALAGANHPGESSGLVVSATATHSRPTEEKIVRQEPGPIRPQANDWEKSVALMPAAEQFKAVQSKLKELNPEFDERATWYGTENDAVVSFCVNNCANLKDMSPLRALPNLRKLFLYGNGAGDLSSLRGLKLVQLDTIDCPIQDLSPLAGMPLHTLQLWNFRTADLSPLRGMKLEFVNLGGSPVKDISVLKGMPIEGLCLNHSQVEDLSPLEGSPLQELACENTRVTDITPLLKSPLEKLWLSGSPIADYAPLQELPLKHLGLKYDPAAHAKLLRSLPMLETVNRKPIDEFLGDDGK